MKYLGLLKPPYVQIINTQAIGTTATNPQNSFCWKRRQGDQCNDRDFLGTNHFFDLHTLRLARWTGKKNSVASWSSRRKSSPQQS